MNIAVCSVSKGDIVSRQRLIESLLSKGHNLFVFCPESTEGLDFCKNTHYVFIPVSRTGLNPFSDYKTYKAMKKEIEKNGIELIYSYSGAKAVIYSLWAIKGKPCSGYCMINGLGSIFRVDTAKNKVIRTVMTVLYRTSLKNAEHVFFQNSDDMNVLVKKKTVDERKCSVVNGAGVDLEKFPYTPPPKEKICLFVGRLLADKGLREYVSAAAAVKEKYPSARFLVVGGYDNNPMAIGKEEVGKWVENGYIEYLGERHDMPEVYKSCDIFVLPSYHEGTPRTSLEAMATGRPVITTDAPGCRNTVKHGENGYLVPVGEWEPIAKYIEELFEDDSLYENMRAASRNRAEEMYDVNKVNEELLKIMKLI